MYYHIKWWEQATFIISAFVRSIDLNISIKHMIPSSPYISISMTLPYELHFNMVHIVKNLLKV